MVDVLTSERPAGDVLSRVVRITLAGQPYALPVRSIRFNREWKAQLDARTTGVVNALVEAGNDWESVLSKLEDDVEPFIDLLVSYAPDVLSRALIEDLEPDPSMDVIQACREVWLAASPLVAIGLEAMTEAIVEPPPSGGSRPTSSPPPSTAGSPTSSRNGSPTSSSSPTSTPRPIGSAPGAAPSSTAGSSPSGRARSSPRTSGRSRAGGGKSTGARSGRKASAGSHSSRP